jgi:predicted methyltransferase
MLRASFAAIGLMGLAGCASHAGESSATSPRADSNVVAATPSRPQADRNRDADRKPAQRRLFLQFRFEFA